jgi:hypothetical protein
MTHHEPNPNHPHNCPGVNRPGGSPPGSCDPATNSPTTTAPTSPTPATATPTSTPSPTSPAALVRHHGTGQHLDAWIDRTRHTGYPEHRAFAASLTNARDAVLASLTQPWNSGPAEGHVNRIKTIKRQMYGRANLDLLRKRVLATP